MRKIQKDLSVGSRVWKFCAVGAMSAVAAACGSDDQSTANLELKGVAATGAAMPSAAVSAKCNTGTGTATTSSAGAYTITIANGSLPCVLRATSSDGRIVLHSAIEGTGAGSANANVTPMSELIVSEAQGGGSASAMFEQFDSNKTRLDAANLNQAKDRVRSALSSVTNLTGVDPIKDVLVAATNSSAGNELDLRLDALRDALAKANLSVAEVATMMKDNSGGSIGEIIRVGISQPSSACKGFRSGNYRVIEPAGNPQVYDVSFDANTLKATTPDGTLQMVADGCKLSALDGTTLVMAKSGVGIMRTSNGTLATVIPKQTLGFADLAGTWNWVQREKPSQGTNFSVAWGETTFSSTGKATADKKCVSTSAPCQIGLASNLPQIELQTDGGFKMQGDANSAFYGFRAANGGLAVVGVSVDGTTLMARSGLPPALPAVGDVQKRADIGVSSSNVVDSAFANETYRVSSVDTPNLRYTRTRASDCRVDTLNLSVPFSLGFSREAGTSPNCGSGTVSFGGLVGLASHSMGIAAYVMPSSGLMGFSVVTD